MKQSTKSEKEWKTTTTATVVTTKRLHCSGNKKPPLAQTTITNALTLHMYTSYIGMAQVKRYTAAIVRRACELISNNDTVALLPLFLDQSYGSQPKISNEKWPTHWTIGLILVTLFVFLRLHRHFWAVYFVIDNDFCVYALIKTLILTSIDNGSGECMTPEK